MAPLRSIAGRSLGKLLEGFKTSTLGQGFGSGGGGGGSGPVTTSGGTLIDAGDYWINVFTDTASPQNYVIIAPDPGVNADILMVGGGGAGGGNVNGPPNYGGGGGGAGGLLHMENYPLGPGVYTLSVGSGGASETSGTPTTFVTSEVTIVAYGGGRGAAFPGVAAQSGGSGGGATPYEGASTYGEGNKQTGAIPGTPIPAISGVPSIQGYDGSSSVAPEGGGGGGAGQAGQGVDGGGNGLPIPWVPPSYGTPGPTPGRWFAGGGGGGNYGSSTLIPGGFGGGGSGGNCSGGTAGQANTGGGGGGSGCPSPGYDGEPGGSGIIAIRVSKTN